MGPIRVRYGSIRVQFWIFGVKYPVPFTYLQILVQILVIFMFGRNQKVLSLKIMTEKLKERNCIESKEKMLWKMYSYVFKVL